MAVSSILKMKGRDVVPTSPDQTIASAATVLADRRIGSLVVIDKAGALVGILSERDIVRAVARHGNEALSHTVSRYMTSKVEVARESDRIQAIMERMTAGKFRHMPVVENGRVVGMISIGDVVKYRLAEMEAEAEAMRNYITA
ncbi:MAG: CBS domain-containing protein [bacterium]|jgi:CBS domain-containing protein